MVKLTHTSAAELTSISAAMNTQSAQVSTVPKRRGSLSMAAEIGGYSTCLLYTSRCV